MSGEVFLRATLTDAAARAKVEESVYSGLEITLNALGKVERVGLVDRPNALQKRGKAVNKAVLDKALSDLQQAERRLVAITPQSVAEAKERLATLHQLRAKREDLLERAAPVSVGLSRDNDDGALAVVRAALNHPIIGGDALMRNLNRYADH